MKAGKLVNYISAPVMGGFITGICTTIILMQVPKLMGGTAGVGELIELVEHIGQTKVNLPSLIFRRHFPSDTSCIKESNAEISNGSAFNGSRSSNDKIFPVREWGIQTLSAVEPDFHSL